MDERAQTSIEMLLIISAVVVVATIVGLFLKNLAAQQIVPTGQNEIQNALGGF